MVTCEFETIDREKAHQYLAKGEERKNRPLSKNHVGDLVARQKRGEWITNGDSIIFDVNGLLRDGQHRLSMVIATGIPIDAVVVRNVAEGAFLTMDVGRRRSLSDALYIQKEANHYQLASTVALVWRYLSRRMTQHVGSHEELLAVLDAHPGTRDSVVFYKGLEPPPGAPAWDKATMACHYLFSRIDASAANDFIRRYVTGESLESGTPLFFVRGQIVALASSKTKNPNSAQIITLLCRAWNLHRAGREQKKHFDYPVVAAASPRIDDFPRELFINRQLPFDNGDEEEEDDQS